jgi:hypothetical protein
MNRRRFLKTATLGAAALVAAPAFVRRAFGDETCDTTSASSGLVQLSDGYRRAQRAGRPLLLLVVPADDGEKFERGRAFGELLNHGSDAQLAPLGLCEVLCAGMTDIRRLIPSAGAGEPLMVLVDASRVPAQVKRLDVKLPAYDSSFRGRSEVKWDEQVRTENAISERRIETLANLIRDAVAPGSAGLTGQIPSLAADVRARLTHGRVPGSRWASSSGCGTTVEDDDDTLGIGCGMGHVPEKAQRFLYLYAQTPAQQFRAQQEKYEVERARKK